MVEATATAAFTTEDLPEWHVAVEGCLNFRDAGGWPALGGSTMRHGALYRSDDPVRLTPRGREAVAGLGLVHVVDLRQHSQFIRTPGFVDAERTAHIALLDRVIDPDNPPALYTPADMAELYFSMIERSRDQLAAALDSVADHLADGPVLVHCAFGKDRAGLVTALIQAAIGVPAEAIVEDYARSSGPGRRRRAWLVGEPLPDDPVTTHVPEVMFTAPAEAMAIVVDRMTAEHGSLDAWVASFPVRPDTIARLRHALLHP